MELRKSRETISVEIPRWILVEAKIQPIDAERSHGAEIPHFFDLDGVTADDLLDRFADGALRRVNSRYFREMNDDKKSVPAKTQEEILATQEEIPELEGRKALRFGMDDVRPKKGKAKKKVEPLSAELVKLWIANGDSEDLIVRRLQKQYNLEPATAQMMYDMCSK